MKVMLETATGRVIATWNEVGSENDPPPKLQPGHEIVDDPRSSGEFWLEADQKAGGKAGAVRLLKDGTVQADPAADASPGLLGELEGLRKATNKRPDQPLTWGDIEQLARERRK